MKEKKQADSSECDICAEKLRAGDGAGAERRAKRQTIHCTLVTEWFGWSVYQVMTRVCHYAVDKIT